MKPYLLIAALAITPQIHAELWRDVTDQSIRDRNQTLFINEVVEKQKDGQLIVAYKSGQVDSTFYGLNKLLVNCVEKSVRSLGGQYYVRDYQPTNKGSAPTSTYIDKDLAPEYQRIYNIVCRE